MHAIAMTLLCVGAVAAAPLPRVDPVKQCPVPVAGKLSDASPKLFYNCAERLLKCGPESYLVGYGGRYATTFWEWSKPRMGKAGKQFVDKALVCLQTRLRAEISMRTKCDDIYQIAFDTHPGCYVDSGFCHLPVGDIFTVLRTIDAQEYFSKAFHEQVTQTIKKCARVRFGH